MAKRGPKGPSRYTESYVDQLADDLIEYVKTSELPYLKDFAFQQKIPAHTFTDNENFINNKKFSVALKLAKDKLEHILVDNGLKGKFNASMCIFTLKNVAGWRDSALIDQSQHNHYSKVEVVIKTNAKPEVSVAPKTRRSFQRQESLPGCGSG